MGAPQHPVEGKDPSVAAQLISTKLVVIGVLISATIWAGRIYKALMHQAEVYHHKATCIKTLRAFIHSVKDPVISDSIVAEGARSVFGNVPTGFIDSSKDSADGSMRILEVAKSLIPGGER